MGPLDAVARREAPAQRLPQQYPGWVNRWSDYAEADGVLIRPWVGGQDQDLSRRAAGVEFREVTTPDRHACPCGMSLQVTDSVGNLPFRRTRRSRRRVAGRIVRS